MLKKTGFDRPPVVRLGDAPRGDFFTSGLEYNPPARGVWNIVHTGMLIPEVHEIFACAQGCLRGVILTAAEMNALDRMSWISVSEQDMFDGTLESDVVDGVSEIIEGLPYRPRAVLLYLSCIHLFAGCDFDIIIQELSDKFPDIDFSDCYMTPTMRKNVSPDAKMRAQLYNALKPLPVDERSVNIIGNDRATDENSELVRIIKDNGFTLRDITSCKTYDEYLEMAKSAVNIAYLPTAAMGCNELSERLGTKALYLPYSFDSVRIRENIAKLCDTLGVECPDLAGEEEKAKAALASAKTAVGDTPIAIDFTAVTQPFSLAKLLVENGFNVKYIINDVLGEDGEDFDALKEISPDIEIYSAVNVNMLHFPEEEHERVIAVGQKAAHYFSTDYFVNIVQNGGYYGFTGIAEIARLMEEAAAEPKDRRTLISHKGIGCESCI
ncbi:nitrogenase component 1 [Ruminococcus albus]|uniref:Nitrogenase component 1 type Oxidoreductase n=1 Tax=Ruminococcus albus TaxID=1264 RepID=A0A1H7K2J3_RUMAL|nr:nitrogenase component 1 [Ruminococcus albus]SEK80650.1 Nitrogenase component 1 type Oxidoreductase [Ruminococcus albus]